MPDFRALLLAVCLGLCALRPAASSAQDAADKFWIFFTDKPTEAAEAVVTAKAQARRALRGRPVPAALDAPPSAGYLERLRAAGITPLIQSRWLNAVSAHLDAGQRRAAERLPFVRAVQPVARMDAPPIPAPSPLLAHPAKASLLEYGPSLTQLAVMNAVAPLERGFDGTGVTLGFLDTEYGGFEHPAFAPLVAEGRLLAVREFTEAPQSNRHGRMVASVAVGYDEGQLIGPAHGAFVLAGTTEYAPTETNQEEDNLVAGLEWMEAMGADVVNISLGYTTFDTGERSYTPADLDGNTAVTTVAVDRAAALGLLVVTSAGNSGCNSPANCWYYVGTPADADSALAVGAVMADSSRAFFSSFGPTADGRIKPDVSALGQGVYVAASATGYGFSAGTSFSSPLTAAVACQILQANPLLSPQDVIDILRETASQAEAPDNVLGWGIVNADAAVRLAERLYADALQRDAPLVQTYPNPASGTAVFQVRLTDEAAGEAVVRLRVYDLLGRRVADVFDGSLGIGLHRLRLSVRNLPAGLYLYAIETPTRTETGSFVVAH